MSYFEQVKNLVVVLLLWTSQTVNFSVKNFGQVFDGYFLDQSYFAVFRQIKDFSGIRQVKAGFEQVKKILVFLLTLNKSNTVCQAAFGYLLALCSTCVTYMTPCHATDH